MVGWVLLCHDISRWKLSEGFDSCAVNTFDLYLVSFLRVCEFVHKFSMCTTCDMIESMYWHLEDIEFPKCLSTSNLPLVLAVILTIYF